MIFQLCDVVPAGMLVVFSSYSLMNTVRLHGTKQIFCLASIKKSTVIGNQQMGRIYREYFHSTNRMLKVEGQFCFVFKEERFLKESISLMNYAGQLF